MEYGKLYFVGNIGNGLKKHLAYKDKFDDVIFTLCLPNIPMWACWDCEDKKNGGGFPAGIREALEWDEYFNEVTCPTCLARAGGLK